MLPALATYTDGMLEADSEHIIGAAMTLLFVILPARRALLQGIQTVRARLQEAFQDARRDELFGNVVEGIALMEREAEEAKAFLLEQKRPMVSPKKAPEYLIMALSVRGETLSTQEIIQCMVARGYGPRGQDAKQHVRRLLRGHFQLFARKEDGCWSTASQRSDEGGNDAECESQKSIIQAVNLGIACRSFERT